MTLPRPSYDPALTLPWPCQNPAMTLIWPSPPLANDFSPRAGGGTLTRGSPGWWRPPGTLWPSHGPQRRMTASCPQRWRPPECPGAKESVAVLQDPRGPGARGGGRRSWGGWGPRAYPALRGRQDSRWVPRAHSNQAKNCKHIKL